MASLCKCNIVSPHFYKYISHLVKVVNIVIKIVKIDVVLVKTQRYTSYLYNFQMLFKLLHPTMASNDEDYSILLSAMFLFFPSCFTMVSEGDKGAFHVCTAHFLEPNH
jgi:hypothetical protein